MFNRAQMWATDQDKSKLEQAYLSKKHNIWDTFGQQLEHDARTEKERKRSLADALAKSDIQNAVNADPNKYGAGLNDEELAIHKRIQSGESPSKIMSENANNTAIIYSMRNKLSQVQQAQLSQYYGITPSRWAVIAKDGTKLEIAKIRARTEEAKRFQKQIKECIDRNDKAIDRLSKSLYGLIKSIK